ncbi:DUF3781 domain-containing protein [Treponema sp. OttesenSCG-928-L16]|nr:DUF3781 domain-containing protein [Treponema sp. OttesenSCG-928-L16]
MKDLLAHLDKLHTTELGVLRLQKNLDLDGADAVSWCKEKIKTADRIIQEGKNWYVFSGDIIITINVHSNTIITAHKEKRQL